MEITINLPEDVANVFLADGESIEREEVSCSAEKSWSTP